MYLIQSEQNPELYQMVMGPAGTGKSTYCRVIQEHCQNIKRSIHVVNLDPAAESFEYEVAFDIRGDQHGMLTLCPFRLFDYSSI